ncbi:M20/M25/M40 family metallo-hydrolase [Halorussus sp. AFM4]|uniref:M20/M25/M40 family metallo-hydrolase n=1 Tax=Halorussus sp. AFM4 TaxID=3421651 RepID=UPI003EBEE1AB
MTVHHEIKQRVFEHADRHTEVLRSGLQASLQDVETFQQWVAERLELVGASTSDFTLQRGDIEDQPAFQEELESNPDGMKFGKNVVGRFPSREDTKQRDEATTLLFAHADKSPASYRYATEGVGVDFEGGRLAGPGIADDVSGVTAAIGALQTLAEGGWDPATSVSVASILGKQLGVAGTYGLMRQHGPADAAVYVHPAESGQGLKDLKVGSNGLYECTVILEGRPPQTSETHHPLYAHQGVNPVDAVGPVTQQLHAWTDELADKHAHSGVEDAAGTSAGVLLSDVDVDDSGRAVYEMPQRCTITIALAFPPSVSLDIVEEGVRQTVYETAQENGVTSVAIHRGDHVAESAETPTNTAAVQTADTTIEQVTGHSPTYYYGHTASDIRYPILYWNAPTVGFGPEAGAMGDRDEWIDREEYLETIATLAVFLVEYTPTT